MGLTLTNRLLGKDRRQQAVNTACRDLASKGLVVRRVRQDGLTGNYSTDNVPKPSGTSPDNSTPGTDPLSEDSLKVVLESWLERQGWSTEIAWGKKQGVDIEARRAGDCWRIEVKGRGSSQPMRVNYFLAVLGELLQKMDEQACRYSIALPDLPQFRGLWDRLPREAKKRIRVSAIFVDEKGSVRLA